ncbi:sulfite exporter TauE/SafE family protein [Hyphomicrobium sp. CS1GBMeth3]|uniref:sulfite exporter TauE/SafE family protein n=1 Tax=Hyphomicrobium sp. CS1GBMeth3 TaxID=1892845 RepID=UPI001FCDE24C|nr:sulfite exporter TauE/SafE family protein [Hyphomicrobium sp. CS1GBMeth3]
MRLIAAFIAGLAVGVLGGLIGLGGAEFRLPLLIAWFDFLPLQAVIINKAMSLIVVSSALPFRANTVPFGELASHWFTIANLLSGSLIGAWVGAGWAMRLSAQALQRTIAIILVVIAVVLFLGHDPSSPGAVVTGSVQIAAGVLAGFWIGVVAALLGVAGGELLIPTLILLFGVDVKLAGSLSLAVSLPTMIVGFARYSRDRSFEVLRQQSGFVVAMAAGSIVGSFVGGQLLGIVPSAILIPLLVLLLLISAAKAWVHENREDKKCYQKVGG